MSRFIEIHRGSSVYLVNADAIQYVSQRGIFDAKGTIHFDKRCEIYFDDPFETVRRKLLDAAKEGKENFPPTTPHKEKGEVQQVPPPARACEESLACEGVLIPTLDEVKSAAPGLGVDPETAEDFWNFFYALGWKYKGDTIRKWQPMLKAWKNTRLRLEKRDEKLIAHFDERAEKRAAHIDARMDEREAKREKRIGGRRKADNNVEMSDEVREEVRRDFAI